MNQKLKKLLNKISDISHESRYVDLYQFGSSTTVDNFIKIIKEKSQDLIDPVMSFDNDGYEDGYTYLRIEGYRNKSKEEIEKEKQQIIDIHNHEIKQKKILEQEKQENELKQLAKLKRKYEKNKC
jgi:hypothetical protein